MVRVLVTAAAALVLQQCVQPPILYSCFDRRFTLSLSCSDYLSLPSVGIQIKNRLKDENIALSLPSQVRAVSTPTEQG